MNKCDFNSKPRILSVIANDFGCHEVQENLKVSSKNLLLILSDQILLKTH